MNAHSEPALNVQDLPGLFSKYGVSILLTTLISTGLSLSAANHIPKKYKAHFVLTIYSKYFQSPLVGDFVPGLSESGDPRAQRESLIRQGLTPEYLDSLGTKYGIYDAINKGADASSGPFSLKALVDAFGLSPSGNKNSELSADREYLRSRIEIDSINSATFKIGFVYSDPAVTLQVTQDIYDHVIQNLLQIRLRILTNIRDAIQNRVSALSANLVASAPVAPGVPTDADNVATELESVRAEIRTMSSQYTDEHPLMIQLRDQERMLANRLDNLSDDLTTHPSKREGPSSGEGGGGESARDIYGDLAKKLNYLNIAIDSDDQHHGDYFATLEPPLYPSSSLGPKKGLIALWGVALGLFGSLFISAIREYFARSTLHAVELAHQLNLPLLGELPSFPSKTAH